MALAGLQPQEVIPRGGVVKVEIVCAPGGFGRLAGQAVDRAALNATFAPTGTAATYTFREDGARYTTLADGPLPPHLIHHTIVMTFAAGEASRRAMEEIAARSNGGFIAAVTMATGERLAVGWSERFGVLYPLTLKSMTTDSGASPADNPSLTLTLESIDANLATPI